MGWVEAEDEGEQEALMNEEPPNEDHDDDDGNVSRLYCPGIPRLCSFYTIASTCTTTHGHGPRETTQPLQGPAKETTQELQRPAKLLWMRHMVITT